MRRFALLTSISVASLACMALAAPAMATFHLNRIREVHEGPTGVGSGSYIELQAVAAGQNFVSAHYLNIYDNGGNLYHQYQFTGSVSNGASQATILVSDGGPLPGGVTPDFVDATLNIPTGSGAVCFMDTPTVGLDCVSYGNSFAAVNMPSPTGSPAANDNTGLGLGQTLVRSIGAGCATLFDFSDDTNDSAADFAIGPANPRNNTTAPTERACGGGGGGGGGGGTPDTSPPNTSFKLKPPGQTADRTPKFKFRSTEAGSTFQCRVDRAKKFRKCTSPLTLKKLGFGKHVLRVRAVDAAGNVDKTAATSRFKVVRPLP